MKTLEQAARQALEALELYMAMDTPDENHILEVDIAPKALTALREALEQPAQQEQQTKCPECFAHDGHRIGCTKRRTEQHELEVAMVDAAMVEMKNIVPPLCRSECKRLIRAALNVAASNAQEQEPVEVKPLPGADWTISMRRILRNVAGGCSKRECRCKPEDAPNCIWWDEPEQSAQQQSKPWVGLTDDERAAVVDEYFGSFAAALMIEAKLREKNT